MKKFITILYLGVFLTAPIAVLADHNTEHTIQQLQAQIQALQSQITKTQQQQPRPPQTVPSRRPVATAVEKQPQSLPTFFTRDLYLGMRNSPDVSDLQEFLTDQGYYAGPISGNFGLLTLSAVKKFQSTQGINPSGYFGPRSRAVASEMMSKLVGQICPQEEGCEGNVLPAEKIYMTANSDLNGTVGEYLKIIFAAFGGSGNYNIQVIDGDVPGLGKYIGCEISKDDCPRDKIALAGVPIKAGAFGVTFLVRDRVRTAGSPEDVYSGAYGKEQFTIVIKDKISSGRLPVISGVKGPTALKVGEAGIWSIEAQDQSNGALVYRVIWGDEEKVRAGLEKEAAARAIPFRQTATFTHTYYTAGIYTPTFYVVNDRGLEVKTSISVNVQESPLGTITVSEKVKCIFNGAASEQKCYAGVETSTGYHYDYGCSGMGLCVADIKGDRGSKITWKSSCDGYAYTTMDGLDESAEFKCGIPTTTVSEQVKCVFNGSQSEQKCSTAVTDAGSIYYNRGCSGVGACVVDIKGYKGDSIIWKSSCLEGYTYTTVDGQNKYANFKCGTSTAASITVLSPNGGEQLIQGQTVAIRWTTTKSGPDYVTIYLTQNGNTILSEAGTIGYVPNTGTYNWVVYPIPSLSGSGFKIKIQGNGIADESDAPFSIVSTTTTSNIGSQNNYAAILASLKAQLDTIAASIKALPK